MGRAVVVSVVLLLLTGCGGSSSSKSSSSSSAGRAAAQVPSFPPPLDAAAKANVLAAGLPALPSEHGDHVVHAHLDVFVDGGHVVVPGGIGIDVHDHLIAPMHTHDDSGIVHIESPVQRDYTLGELFQEWGVRLDGDCLDRFCGPQQAIALWVDGDRRAGDPRTLVIAQGTEIVVTAGTPPKPVPNHYRPYTGF